MRVFKDPQNIYILKLKINIFLLKLFGYFHKDREAQGMSIVSYCHVIINDLSQIKSGAS
jgi:hypothetical protein